MKKILLTILAGVLTLTSCQNDFDPPQTQAGQFTATGLPEPNTSIHEVRSQYAATIAGNSYQKVKNNMVFDGIVVANDISGNIYQFIYLQDINEDGTSNTDEGGIAVGIKGIGCLYTIFPVGQRVRINLKDLYVGGYGASPRIGMPYINTNGTMRLGPMTLPFLASNIELVGKPDPMNVLAREVSGAELNSEVNVAKWSPMLVVMRHAEISDAGWPYAHWETGGDTYSEYHDITIENTKVRQLLNTSTSATFAGDTIRSGKKTIFGLLNRYSSSPQLSIRSIEDIVEE